MHVSRAGSKLLANAALLAGALLAAACGGVTQFQGQTALNVTGTPPAPPPPPPPPKEEPPPPPPRVVVKDNKVEIGEKIQFEVAKATILPQSFSLMDEITDTIKKNPQIKKLSIEGHASSEGDAARNLKLSDDRAKAVMKYIVDKGVDASRLVAKGFGAKKPIADNATEEGKEKNRRVEFVIVEQDVTQKKIEVDHTGKEKVIEEKKMTEKKEEPAAAAAPADAKKDAAAPAAASGKKLPALKPKAATPAPAPAPAEKK
jgi:outer membrane protein OmpA-like peptidoglycan-associated protein